MEKKAKKSKKAAPKVPKIDPDMPLNVVGNLLRALEGEKFILITEKDGQLLLDRHGISSRIEFLGMIELAKV